MNAFALGLVISLVLGGVGLLLFGIGFLLTLTIIRAVVGLPLILLSYLLFFASPFPAIIGLVKWLWNKK